MKKIYIYVALLLPVANAFAQTTIDFESINLSPDSYNYGSDGNGNFIFDELTLENVYDVDYDYHLGFAISNQTDVTTAGWTNQFSSFTGGGAGSDNFGIYYNSGKMIASNQASISSFKITNTTYAALSMKDGDGFGKQFGSIYAGDGTTVDGTNGEDFFKVWIIASDHNGTLKDSVEFYLADYRFSDNTQDYIVDQWETIDLSGVSFNIGSVDFRFESSDSDPTYGPNTPTYFAIDDVTYTSLLSTNELADNEYAVFPTVFSNQLTINGEEGYVAIVDVQGKEVYSSAINGELIVNCDTMQAGVYFVTITNSKGTLTKKIIKA